MIDRLVVSNLRRAQQFDRGLRTMAGVERAIDQHIRAAILTADPVQREKSLALIAKKIKAQVDVDIMPQAVRIGRANSTDVARKLGKVKNALPKREQQLAEVALNRRVDQRKQIVRDQIDASINRLKSQLSKYWSDPSEGSLASRKRRMAERFKTQEKKRRQYEKDFRAFHEGRTDKRPSKPKLDFGSELTSDVKTEIRSQARRSGTDAEISVFRARGHALYIWVTPNGAEACPDCKKRQSVVLTIEQWEANGRPGSGLTVCGDACYCTLLPVESIDVSPSLITGVNSNEPGPMTSAAQMKLFNANRMKRPEKS